MKVFPTPPMMTTRMARIKLYLDRTLDWYKPKHWPTHMQAIAYGQDKTHKARFVLWYFLTRNGLSYEEARQILLLYDVDHTTGYITLSAETDKWNKQMDEMEKQEEQRRAKNEYYQYYDIYLGHVVKPSK